MTTTTLKEVYPDIFDPDLKTRLATLAAEVAALKALPPPLTEEDVLRLRAATEQQNEVKEKADRQERRYFAVRKLLLERFAFPATPALPDKAEAFPGSGGSELNDDQKTYFVAVHGLLLADNYDDPEMRAEGNDVPGAIHVEKSGDRRAFLIVPRFVSAVVDAVKELQANKDMFARVFRELRDESRRQKDVGGTPCDESTIKTREVAVVARRVVELGVEAGDQHVRLQILEALAIALRGRSDGSASEVVIDLPDIDLDQGTESDIHRDNVIALSAIYYTAMLEEMKLFAVADRVVEQFQAGMVPIARGPGGDRMYRYYREAVNRFTEAERRSLYARAFGVAQGSVDEPLPNREFSDLWIRFLSAVSLFKRQASAERMLVHPQQVFKSARDVAVNLSLHGYGIAHFAAVEMQRLVRDVVAMLSHPDVLKAYGVFHIWQLVDRVSQLYLGGAVNGVQHRTMAHSGGSIIKWLGEHARLLSSPFSRGVGSAFADDELVGYVERWLAVTGTNDQTVETFSEPVVAQTQLTIPSMQMPNLGSMQGMPQMPDAMRGALNRVGGLMPQN